MSESVAAALGFCDDDATTETRVFIRMIDTFFDCLNVKDPISGIRKRKPNKLPYKSHLDERFKVSKIYKLIFINSF